MEIVVKIALFCALVWLIMHLWDSVKEQGNH